MPGHSRRFRSPHASLIQRLLSNSAISEECSYADSPCWDWLGCLDKDGYGRISLRICGKHHNMLAHRVALYAFKGYSLRRKRKCRHLCDRRCCISPLHLQYGTQKQNMQDAMRRGTHITARRRAEKESAADALLS